MLHTLLHPLLAQSATQLERQTREAVNQAGNWLTQDPIGRWVGIAIVGLVTAVALVVFFKSFRWAAARWKTFVALAIALAAAYLGAIYVFNLGPTGWIVGGFVAFALFIGAALAATQGGGRR